MLKNIGDWTVVFDMEATLSYSEKVVKDHCQCGYCRNFYRAVDTPYPSLRPFLADLGCHVEAPDELMPFEPTVLDAIYMVCGKIITVGSQPLQLDGLWIEPVAVEELDFDSQCPAPCFALSVSRLEIPWLLEENMEDVISPANEPEYLQRMWTKLLQEQENEPQFS